MHMGIQRHGIGDTPPVGAAGRTKVDGDSPRDRVLAERHRHGFRHAGGSKTRAKGWSKDLLAMSPDERPEALQHIPAQISTVVEGSDGKPLIGTDGKPVLLTDDDGNLVPKNIRIMEFAEERLRIIGFGYIIKTIRRENGELQCVIEWINWPTVGGMALTLIELCTIEIRDIDNYDRLVERASGRVGKSADFDAKRAVMDRTGVGYKGFFGVSWMPSVDRVVLPASIGKQIVALAAAVYLLHDAVRALYPKSMRLRRLLNHLRPDRILEIMMEDSVDMLRPDIIIVRDLDGTFRPVVTELESAPAGQGMAHAMQIGYGLEPTLVDTFVEYLAGRPFRIIATNEWSEYTWDQAVWVNALRERGVDAELWFDASLEEVATGAAAWKMPGGMPDHMRKQWDTDFLARLRQHGFDVFTHGFTDGNFPEPSANTVLFRFGYFDNFSHQVLRALERWADDGCSVLNGHRFCLETKVLMAAAQEEEVRDWIKARDPDAVAVLDRCLATTHLLAEGFVDRDRLEGELTDVEKDGEAARKWWLTKFAAWDGKNMSWGSRSLVVGSEVSETMWRQSLDERFGLPHAVVAQHMILSHDYDVEYVGSDGTVQVLHDAKIRVTPFFFRMQDGSVRSVGTTGTWRAGTSRIHGATDAVEGPIVYSKEAA